jgi:hypothetical protein
LAFVVLLFLAPLSKRSLQANYNDSRPWQLGGHRPRAVDAADMDAKAIRRAALITLRRAICERFRLGGRNGCIGLRSPRRQQRSGVRHTLRRSSG